MNVLDIIDTQKPTMFVSYRKNKHRQQRVEQQGDSWDMKEASIAGD